MKQIKNNKKPKWKTRIKYLYIVNQNIINYKLYSIFVKKIYKYIRNILKN